MLHLEACLEQGLATRIGGSWAIKYSDITIHEDDVSLKKITSLCQQWNEFMTATPHAVLAKKEKLVAPFSSSQPAAKTEQPQKPIPTPARSLKTEPVKPGDGSKSPCSKPEAPVPPPIVAGGEREESSGKPEPPKSGVELFDQAWQTRLEEIRAARKPDQQIRKSRERAKQILRLCGLDFNSHFQKRHMMRLPSGHWQAFLDAVVAAGEAGEDSAVSAFITSVTCRVCKQLFLDFDIPGARDRHQQQKQSIAEKDLAPLPLQDAAAAGPIPEQTPGDALEGQLASMMDGFDADLEDGPARKKRRGRPRKGEESQFNVLEFLRDERFGQYHLLTPDEASGFGHWKYQSYKVMEIEWQISFSYFFRINYTPAIPSPSRPI